MVWGRDSFERPFSGKHATPWVSLLAVGMLALGGTASEARPRGVAGARSWEDREPPRERPFRFLASVGPTYSVPSGKWFEGVGGGRAGEIAFRYALNARLLAGLSYQRQRLTGTENQFFEEDEITLDEVYARLDFVQGAAAKGRSIWFAHVGIGLMAHDPARVDSGRGVQYSEDPLAVRTGFGMLRPMSGPLALELECSVRVTGQGATNYYDSNSTATGFLWSATLRGVWMKGVDRAPAPGGGD